MSITYQELPDHLTEDAVRVMANALLIEPGYLHLFPDEQELTSVMQAVVRATIEGADGRGKVWAAMDGRRVLGAGVWLMPGQYSPDPESEASTMIAPSLQSLGDHALLLLNEYERNSRPYFPATPCWYLALLGVDPSTQGRGIGSGLARYMLAEIGNDACYLETATPSNVRFYEKLGFQVVDPAAQLTPNNGPTHWTMFRPAT